MYLMVGTRPDIAFALGTLSRFTSQPQPHHQDALQRLLRYVKVTQSHRIIYHSGKLIGYTDADFGGFVVTDGALLHVRLCVSARRSTDILVVGK